MSSWNYPDIKSARHVPYSSGIPVITSLSNLDQVDDNMNIAEKMKRSQQQQQQNLCIYHSKSECLKTAKVKLLVRDGALSKVAAYIYVSRLSDYRFLDSESKIKNLRNK